MAPTSAAVRNNLGNVLRDLERWPEAAASYAEAAALAPEDVPIHANLGAVLCLWAESDPTAAAAAARTLSDDRAACPGLPSGHVSGRTARPSR